MRKVIHLIPYDGVGGVETAARSMVDVRERDFTFHVQTIFPDEVGVKRLNVVHLLWIIKKVFQLYRENPNVLILSLWRSCIVGVLFKMFRPSCQLVLFLHYPDDVHFVDRALTRLASYLAAEVWADSNVTLEKRLPNSSHKKVVISFVTKQLNPLAKQAVRPHFVYWGRIHAQKKLERALSIFSNIYQACPSAQFYVIGPDSGELSNIKQSARMFGVGRAVQFMGRMDFEQIVKCARNASFYLQTSENEGMAMSVVEAMQLGLVPVVTPVGEISNYAHDGSNAIIINDDERAISDILLLIDNNERYQRQRQEAISTWDNVPLYKSSVLEACQKLLMYERKL